MISRGRLIGWSFEIDRIVRGLAILREELAFRTLSEKDWLELGCLMYTQSVKYSRGSGHNESGLFAFERATVEEFFPPPPASILVGACGGGRELFALVERGYRIAAAYDPVATFIGALRQDPRLFTNRDRICVGVHQALESLAPIVELRLHHEPIDAVIVGWESYTHILGKERRLDFLRSLRTVCPKGPVLLSFFIEMGNEAEGPQRLRSKLRRILGTTDRMVETGDGLHRGAGAIHYFSEATFSTEATQAGYHVQHWQEHAFAAAHAVLVPVSTGQPQ